MQVKSNLTHDSGNFHSMVSFQGTFHSIFKRLLQYDQQTHYVACARLAPLLNLLAESCMLFALSCLQFHLFHVTCNPHARCTSSHVILSHYSHVCPLHSPITKP